MQSMISDFNKQLVEKAKKFQKLDVWIDSDGQALHIEAEDQEWNDAITQKELRKLGIFFSHNGVIPVRCIPRDEADPLIELGCEDDGHIIFESTDYGLFDVFWTKMLMHDLRDCRNYITRKKNRERNKETKIIKECFENT